VSTRYDAVLQHLKHRNISIRNPRYVVELQGFGEPRHWGFYLLGKQEVLDEIFYQARMYSGSDILGENLDKVKVTICDKERNPIIETYANYICQADELLSIS